MENQIKQPSERQKPHVLFVGGAGRSGSTLLENVLANSKDVVCVGEAKMVWKNGLADNLLTPQGTPFKENRFWCEVFEEGWGGLDKIDLDRITYLQNQVDRTIHLIPNEVGLLRSSRRQALIDEYLIILERLYCAIYKVSGAKLIVDSTKWPIYGSQLCRSKNIDLSLIHLVRTPCAVYFSWRSPKRRPEISGHQNMMMRPSRSWIVAKWLEANIVMKYLSTKRPCAVLHYEDFVADPYQTLKETFCQLSLDQDIIDKLNMDKLVWGKSYSMQGNPVRFSKGNIQFVLDERWKKQMGWAEKALLTAATCPVNALL